MPRKNRKKMWNKIALKFDKWMKTDDYPQKLTAMVHKEPYYTILDLGCGNGSITLEVAKHVKEVTAVDISEEMLNLVMKGARDKGLNNIKYVQSTVEALKSDQIGKYDVVIASRSLGGIYNLQKELKKIDKLAKKYVYITIWGANARQFEKELCQVMGTEYHQHPDYIYVCNMLYQLGIYANVKMLDLESRPVYSNLEDVMERCMWKLGWITDEIKETEKKKLEKFLKKTAAKNEDGTLHYPSNKPDWVLLWWKKKNND
jgi:ubiquinone/menaquinone biosynthesis C-methylase UbiE